MKDSLRLLPTDDPRDLDLKQRRALAAQMGAAQANWLRRLSGLVEPPAPTPDFPAFLLATPPFAVLREAVGEAHTAVQLPLAVRDQLQWFVDAYRDYLRTTEGEAWFSERPDEAPLPARP